MLRKLNFTERTKIPRSAIQIALRRESDGVLAFDPVLDLSSVSAPATSRVYIEAHYRTSYMRFDCGTLGDLTLPDDRRLSEIDSGSVVRFRVKVVDNTTHTHRIVAAADDITVSASSIDGGSRVPLLEVNFRDLGDLPWRVELETNGPVLELNNRVEGIERMARHDAAFFALVYPAAVREILTHILVIEQYDVAEESDEWWSLWLRWAREMTDAAMPAEIEDRRVWIDEVAAAFCGRHRVIEKLQRVHAEEKR
ncbi:MAG: hypothetical protein M3P06_23830 [Acidobacteriota bacterium]|nr:hypothetical protein [Acidobacteriota bacterium]